MNESYDDLSFGDDCFDSLQGHDQAVANDLDEANENLPEDEQFTFYFVQYEQGMISDENGLLPGYGFILVINIINPFDCR